MGMILDDKEQGIHCEKRRESIVLYDDFGGQSIEMDFEQTREAVSLLQEALAMNNKTLDAGYKEWVRNEEAWAKRVG